MVVKEPEEGKNTNNYQRRSDGTQNRAAKYLLEMFPFVRTGWEWLRKRDRETVNAISTSVLAVATFALFLVAVAQRETAEKTDATLRAAQRPWMKYLSIDIISPLTYKDNIVETKIRFHLQNVGNSPALHVIPSAVLLLNDLTDAGQRKLCDPMRDEPIRGSDQGFVSFPGIEPIAEEHPISARLDHLDMSPYINKIGPPPLIIFTIASCITYRSSLEDKAHQTGIILNLITPRLSTPSNPSVADALVALSIEPKLGNIQPSDLQTAVWHEGSYAD